MASVFEGVMRVLMRIIGVLCFINIVVICLMMIYGALNPAPLMTWNGSKITLYDVRTGADYAFPNPRFAITSPSVSGLEILQSADEAYSLIIRSDSTGLSINLRNRADEILMRLERDSVSRINNIGWLDNQNFVIIRVSTGSLSMSVFNVDSLSERQLGRYSNTAYSFSPNREWLLLIENDTEESVLRHFFDERRYTLNPISDIASWSNDGRYLATRTRLGDSLGLQLVDTTTGVIETHDFRPNRLSWSSNNQSLIAYSRHQILLYNNQTYIFEETFSERLLNVHWSSDGRYAVVVAQGDDEKILYLLDAETEILDFWTVIPDSVNERSIAWAYDNNSLTYIVPNSQANQQSLVLRIEITQNEAEFFTSIPSNISRAIAVDDLHFLGDLP